MIWAEIAKGLVEKDAALLLPSNEEKLRNEIQAIYDRDAQSGSLYIPRKSPLQK